MLEELCNQHKLNKKWSTAALYSSVIKKINGFTQDKDVYLNDISSSWLKSFEGYMRSNGNSWNTVSTYMRILHTAINEAVMTSQATFRPLLFNKVYTGVVADRQNALEPKEMEKLIKLSLSKKSPLKPVLQQTLQYFVLSFMLRGMPLVDIAFLKKKEWKRGMIAYRRLKTGRSLVVELEEPAIKLINILMDKETTSPYLFPLLHYPDDSENAYKEYKKILKLFNYRLKVISKLLNIDHLITTYTARHSWVTIAFMCNINTAIISQSVGHSSIKVTETYLKPFQQKAINEANKKVLRYVMK